MIDIEGVLQNAMWIIKESHKLTMYVKNKHTNLIPHFFFIWKRR